MKRFALHLLMVALLSFAGGQSAWDNGTDTGPQLKSEL